MFFVMFFIVFLFFFFFFFQAEDGIRDVAVTGVQTCALPILEVHVLQGERPLARDNRTLGRFQLMGIPPAPRGVPQIEVTFDIDANGILTVSAKDTASGKQQQITISASSGLAKDEVARMVKEAEANATEDARRRQEVELRNETDALVYATQRSLTEEQAKLSSDERNGIER